MTEEEIRKEAKLEAYEEIIEYLESDKPYHRANDPFQLPKHTQPSYAANRPLRWSEPFSLSDVAIALSRVVSELSK